MANENLLGLIEDVNPTEIASHIEAGGIHTWCKAWRNAAKSCLPTVDAKPVVHGRWEWWETMGITFARCSVCDGPIEGDAVVSFAFCPYCGADMRESKED